MKSPAEKGLTGHLLTELRKSRGFSNGPDAAAHVVERTRVVGLGPSVWKEYEAGNRAISDKHREAIESVLGPIGDEQPQPAVAPEMGDLVSALTGLVLEMRRQNDRASEAQAQMADSLAVLTEEVRDLRAALQAHVGAGGPHGAPTPGAGGAPPTRQGGPRKSQAAAR